MKITQALVTIGGTGSKLRKDGVDVPLSKSFLMLYGRPIFHWCLFGLFHAGITDLVVIADKKEKLRRGEETLKRFPHPFANVNLYEDAGLGTTGLPWHARHLLMDEFFFEYGHSISEPAHYRRMSEKKTQSSVVFSAYKPLSGADRPRVQIRGSRITALRGVTGEDHEFVVSAPSLIDQGYVEKLPSFKFNSYRIFDHYLAQNRVQLMISRLPVEIDRREELEISLPFYKKYIREHLLLRRRRRGNVSSEYRPAAGRRRRGEIPE